MIFSFAPGTTVVRRYRHPDRRIAAVIAGRVIADDERGLLMLCDLGAGRMIRVDLDGEPTRQLPLADELTMPTTLAPARQTGHRLLTLMPPGAGHAVTWLWLPDGSFAGWYVNLETPATRWPGGVDTTDLTLDIRVAPDRAWQWKDEDEFDADVLPGFDSSALAMPTPDRAAVRAEGKRVIAQVEAGVFPFDGTHLDFAPLPGWAPAELPADWDAALP